MKALPFPCIRPAAEYAAEVAAPPYDVFDRVEAADYVRDRPHSFLNIDRPETRFDPSQDMYAPEVYAAGAELMDAWLRDGILVSDQTLSYYLYELTWRDRTQTGLVAVCSIDEYEQGVIKRHESTREEKERDRIEHIRALGTQTGPIFLTYRDDPVLSIILGAAKTGSALYDFTDDEGVRQRVWKIHRTETVEAIHAMLERVPGAYIADGHHRTASAVKVGLEMREAARAAGTFTGKEPFNYFLSVLFPASELTILPYNRVVADRAGMDAEALAEAIRVAGFSVEGRDEAVEPSEPGTFGMFAEGRWWEITCPEELLESAREAGPVASLDASILQDRILSPVLGVEDPRTDRRIGFVGGIRGTDELERRAGDAGVAFSLHATSVSQLLDVADAGLLMPPKSTWFEPKLRSGLFMHRIAPSAPSHG